MSWETRPPLWPRATLSWANATGGSSSAAASPKPWVAIARSALVIVWHLLADLSACSSDLGADYYANRIDKGKKACNHIRQLEALGFTVTLTQAA
ncbi:hypothetical protein [Streptosporangium sp. NPDC049304]|uniref:hypothetical protein n=1 Tax=Streptosporangium sp. NPDC049304 TaxID=3154830 RepID=UPI0034169FE7